MELATPLQRSTSSITSSASSSSVCRHGYFLTFRRVSRANTRCSLSGRSSGDLAVELCCGLVARAGARHQQTLRRSFIDCPPRRGFVLESIGSAWKFSYNVSKNNTGAVSYMEDPSSFERVHFPSLFDPASKYLSLIMPAFNEQDRIRSTLDETISYLQDRGKKDKSFTYEIIIVDDGSKDNTTKIGFEYVNKYGLDVIRILKQGVNHGKGAAVRKGMLCSRGQLLLFLDADGASRITDLEKLEAQILQSVQRRQQALSKQNPTFKVDVESVPAVAFGSRAHLEKHALATRKWYRNFLMKVFHLCVLLVAGPGVRDTQCGFKMFTRSAARQLFSNLRLKRWCFDVELVYLCKRLQIPISEVSVTWAEIPGSKVRFYSFVHMLLELVLVRLGYGFHIWKIHTSFTQN